MGEFVYNLPVLLMSSFGCTFLNLSKAVLTLSTVDRIWVLKLLTSQKGLAQTVSMYWLPSVSVLSRLLHWLAEVYPAC